MGVIIINVHKPSGKVGVTVVRFCLMLGLFDRLFEILSHFWQNSCITFSLNRKKRTEEKETIVWYLITLYFISRSGTTVCTQGIYSFLQNVYKRRRLPSNS